MTGSSSKGARLPHRCVSKAIQVSGHQLATGSPQTYNNETLVTEIQLIYYDRIGSSWEVFKTGMSEPYKEILDSETTRRDFEKLKSATSLSLNRLKQ